MHAYVDADIWAGRGPGMVWLRSRASVWGAWGGNVGFGKGGDWCSFLQPARTNFPMESGHLEGIAIAKALAWAVAIPSRRFQICGRF